MPEADAAQAEKSLARTPDRPSAEPPGLESSLALGPAPPAASVLRMQRLVGNRAVGRMLTASRRTLARDPDPYDRNVSRWIKLEPRSVALNAPNVSKMTLTASPVVPSWARTYARRWPSPRAHTWSLRRWPSLKTTRRLRHAARRVGRVRLLSSVARLVLSESSRVDSGVGVDIGAALHQHRQSGRRRRHCGSCACCSRDLG
jgi:hypothetical protein